MEVNKTKNRSINIFVKAGMKYGLLFILYLATAFALSEIVVIGNDYIAKATDSMLAGDGAQIAEILIPLLTMVVLGTITSYISSLCGTHYSTCIQKYVRSTLVGHLLMLPYAYFDEKGSGSVMTKLISDMNEVGRFFSEIMAEFFYNVATVVTITIYLIQMDARLTLVLYATYPLMLFAANYLSKKIVSITKKRRNSMDDRTETAYDAVQGIVVGRSYNLYHKMKERIYVIIDDIAEQGCRSTKVSSMGFVVKNTLTTIPIIICYLFALNETITGVITTGQMLAFCVLLGRILHPLGDVVFIINDMREAGVALSRLNQIYQEQPEKLGTKQYDVSHVSQNELAIRWENVTFSYDGRNQILNGASFTIRKGENVAFAGGSGEGKSTIFKILCGFYERSGGKFELFGHDFNTWNLQTARNCFSVVSQNVFLFPETIWQNVAYGKIGATKEEVIEACKNANIHEFIENLPLGYDTMVGERGVRLSGGERQRISIARAFIKNAPILLLDEPTASIDVGTESMIQEAIARVSVRRTVIVIAHRLSTIQNSDRIFVVSQGEIAEEGTHDELLMKNGIYAGMYGKEVEADAESRN